MSAFEVETSYVILENFPTKTFQQIPKAICIYPEIHAKLKKKKTCAKRSSNALKSLGANRDHQNV
jgi:hypothetical protein